MTSRSRRRTWLFRGLAVLLGLGVFAVVEAACVLFNIGPKVPDEDPFVGFSQVYPLFVLDEKGENYQTATSRLAFFAPDTFPAVKQPGTFRVFCLGGSTVQGEPFSIETAFSTWLKLGLKTAQPERNWEVVNCGGLSYASYRLVPILKECLGYEPDLIIIATGHNEFLEERTYEHIKRSPAAFTAAAAFVSRLRTFGALQQWTKPAFAKFGTLPGPSAQHKFEMKSETDALLDYRNGTRAFHRDDAWKAAVIEHYQFNVRRMIDLAREAGVPVILVRECSNLRDCPPFKSQHRDGLTEAQLNEWLSLLEKARAHYRDDLAWSIDLIEQAIAIDDQYAGTFYELGKCYETLGLADQARSAFLQARELDVCPLRMVAEMEQSLAKIAAETGTPLIDAHQLLEQQADMGILGHGELVDHIHPSFNGHQQIAGELLKAMSHEGWVELPEGWERMSQAAWDKHFKSLPDIYFLKGKEKLEALLLWTQGRADGPPIETRVRIPEEEKK